MAAEYPHNFARFYDVLYGHLRKGVDNQFFLNQMALAEGPILEVGVGTGRFFVDALEAGHDVYGIDISTEMLSVLYKKLPKESHHRVTCQNILSFLYPFNFALIVAPFRVMMHVLSIEDQLKALNQVYYSLEPGGRFIFDVFVPDLAQLLHGLHDTVDFDGEYALGKRLKRIVNTKADLINQLIHVHFRLEWEEGGAWQHEDWKLPMRFFFRYELEHLLARSKFSEYKLLGDYAGGELNETSREFIVICQK